MSDIIAELVGPIFKLLLRAIGYIILEIIGELIIAAIGEGIAALLNWSGLGRMFGRYSRGCAWVFFLIVLAIIGGVFLLALSGSSVNPPRF